MRIAIIGAGRVGSTLGLRWSVLGHEVSFGVLEPTDAQHDKLKADREVRVVASSDAAATAEVIVIAVPWDAALEAVRNLGDLGSKIVIDCTNPVRFGPDGVHPVDVGANSGVERLVGAARGGRFVKTLNQVGFNIMADPTRASSPAAMYVAGDDPAARAVAAGLAAELGFEIHDAGPLRNARALEGLALLWIDQSARGPLGRDFVFSVHALERQTA